MSKRGSGARRKERKEKRDVTAPTATPAKVTTTRRRVEKVQVRTATAPARASTFQVAAAHRQLADDLPSVVHQRSKAPVRRKAEVVTESLPVRETRVGQTRAKAPLERPQREQVKMDKAPQTACKAKPTATRGDGQSRPFVPWCR